MARSLLAPPLPWVSPEGPDIHSFLAYSRRFFDARWYSNSGPLCRELEARLAGLHGVRHCVAFGSSLWGLMLAARAMALPERSMILVPFTDDQRMETLAELTGLIVRGYDRLTGFGPDHVEEVSTRAALVIAGSGNRDTYESFCLRRLAIRADLPLLIDGIEHGEAPEHRQLEPVIASAQLYTLGDSETIFGVEGAYLATDDDSLAEEVKLSRAFGFRTHDDVRILGTNAKLNEVHSAVALAALDRTVLARTPAPVSSVDSEPPLGEMVAL